MPEHEALLKSIGTQWIASVRETIASWDQAVVGPTISRMFGEVEQHLSSQNERFSGAGIALYHESQAIHKDVKEEDIDIETAAPLDKPIAEGARVKVKELPKMEVAYTVHHGYFSRLPMAKRALFAWLQANGYHRAGPIREIYLYFHSDAETNADSPHHITEVQIPVAKDQKPLTASRT